MLLLRAISRVHHTLDRHVRSIVRQKIKATHCEPIGDTDPYAEMSAWARQMCEHTGRAPNFGRSVTD